MLFLGDDRTSKKNLLHTRLIFLFSFYFAFCFHNDCVTRLYHINSIIYMVFYVTLIYGFLFLSISLKCLTLGQEDIFSNLFFSCRYSFFHPLTCYVSWQHVNKYIDLEKMALYVNESILKKIR